MRWKSWIASGVLISIAIIFAFYYFNKTVLRDSTIQKDEKAQDERSFIGALGRIEPYSRVVKVSHDGGPEGACIDELLVYEGAVIEKGDIIAVFNDYLCKQAVFEASLSKIKAIEKQLEIEKNQQEFLKKDVNRHLRLFKAKASAEVRKDEAECNWKKINAKIEELKANLLVAKAENKLAKEKLYKSKLHAPMKGTILKIKVWPGERVNSEGVVEMADLEVMEVVAEVYEKDVLKLKEGQKALISVPGLRQDIEGKVRHIAFQVGKSPLQDLNPLASQDTRAVEVRISIPKEYGKKLQHLIGMQVSVRFLQ